MDSCVVISDSDEESESCPTTRSKIEKSVKNEPSKQRATKRKVDNQVSNQNKRIKRENNSKKEHCGIQKEAVCKSEVVSDLQKEAQCSKQDSKCGNTSTFNEKLPRTTEWNIEEVIAEKHNAEVWVIRNVIKLFDQENTIPFIARYRKEQTGNMEAEMLRHVKDSYERLMTVKQKMESIASSIIKANKMTPSIERALCSAQSMNELEHIYAPFKPASARSLAERARSVGLEPPAMAILEGSRFINPFELLQPNTEALSSEASIRNGLQHVIADVISKDKAVLNLIRTICEREKSSIIIESKKIPEKPTKAKAKEKKSVGKGQLSEKQKEVQEHKFQTYFAFSSTARNIKPHQVLAINRGESLKILTVRVIIPEWVLNKIKDICFRQWICQGIQYPYRTKLVEDSIKDSYNRLLQPLLVRQIRSELLDGAHRAGIEVFAQNLNRLLLTPPLRGKTVTAIDPGFSHGCKLAVVNSNAEVLKTDVLYIHSHRNTNDCAKILREILLEYRCELVALGNGTACRETEMFLSGYIKEGFFKPLDVQYTIVDEQGVSIYSCSPVAKKEFPDTDPNVISAVSLARRLQDPLSELVKVEPKHLGVGMYQHDLPEKKLTETLNEVVVECVSFVGVDVNTASETLLRHVAGLNVSRATNIISWRSTNGPFVNRDQLLLVKGIGQKSFEQCAGFVRILPKTSCIQQARAVKDSKPKINPRKKVKIGTESSPNPLDQTWIHPESYSITYKFMDLCKVSLNDFGTQNFQGKLQQTVQQKTLSGLASELGVPEAQMKLIVEGLQQSNDKDCRSQFKEPLFRRAVLCLKDLNKGEKLTGRIQNVTHFGAFVDVGVGRDGLIPTRYMSRMHPQVGDRVEVEVIDIETLRERFSLGLLRIL